MVTIRIHVAVILSLISRTGLHAEFPLSEVSEGSCLSPDPPQVPFEFEWMLDFVVHAKYTPIASKYFYYLVHNMLRGVPPSELSEWDKMCLITEAGLSLTLQGYDSKSLKLSCDVISLSSLTCYPPDEPSNGTTLSMTWTHNKQYVIFTLCSVDKMKGWSLMSKEKEIPEEIKQKALEHIKQLGFDTGHAFTLNYKGCTS